MLSRQSLEQCNIAKVRFSAVSFSMIRRKEMKSARNILTKIIALITILFVLFSAVVLTKAGYIAFFIILSTLVFLIVFGNSKELKNSKE